jgi:acyl-CoA reductase-like NAD-dependent aldehyde dehydrogenase
LSDGPGSARRGSSGLDSPEQIAGPIQHHVTKLPVGVITIIYPFNWPLAIQAASCGTRRWRATPSW